MPTRKQPEREVVRLGLDDAPTIYVNSVEMAVSFFDIQMRMGQVQDISDKRLVVKILTNVVMSPPHAKALVQALVSNVAVYEDKFGAITLPEGLGIASEPPPPSSRSRGGARRKASRP